MILHEERGFAPTLAKWSCPIEAFLIILIIIVILVLIGRRARSRSKNMGATSDDFKRDQITLGTISDHTSSVALGITIDVEYEGPDVPEVEVTEEEIDVRVKQYAFIIENNRPKQLPGTQAWFKERNQNKFLKTEPERALDWILPFVPVDVATIDKLKPHVEGGPNSAGFMMKEVRAMIRSRRKASESYQDLLEALYGLAVLIDFERSLRVKIGHYEMPSVYVALEDLRNMPIDYQKIGFESLRSPLKTDRKWFIENFGEPMQHIAAEDYFSSIRQLAISRSCWKSFSQEHSLKGSAEDINASMSRWITEKVAFEIKWEKIAIAESEQRVARAPRKRTSVKKSIEATRIPFVVADLETTGLSANQHEITEVAAILVNPDGTVTSEFSSLVKTDNLVPTRITELTGIDDKMLRKKGRHLKPVLEEFLSHTADRPIFFHNAPFDQGFLNAACEAHGLRMQNEIYDTLPLARKAWPSLGQYKLGTLAEFLELEQPGHRALQDARAALSVLLASRDTLIL